MWIFLVLMTIANLRGTKRVRKEPQQISVVSTGEESGSELDPKLCMLRTCKRVMTFVVSIATRQSGSTEDTQRYAIPLVGEGNVSTTTHNMESQTKHSHAPIYFATEVGILMRKFSLTEFHTLEKVPKENKEEMIDRLHKKNGGMTDPQLARSKMKPGCRSKEDWSHLCDYWETDKAQKYADQMKNNQEKLVISSRGDSRSIANHKFSMENILQMKEDECTKLVSARASSGPILRTKDLHILSAVEPSQSASMDEMALKNKVTALEEEVREKKK
ncbi:unnamed protein product [Lactuca saligna]|uniref:Uncharacterized protein n=1 Tax=Lactuca saligna TaxID=75948 RepID=A0AA35VMJ3_LACSI|nr:unnamed protein product [Lactuca saligna]